MNRSLDYRPEIDGLRAIAVLAVVVYHAKLSVGSYSVLSGGFLGVDIFFVISGYLISLILLKETAEGRFSFLRFYERRARRILPALFAVLAFTIGLAWFLLVPEAMVQFAGSGMAALLFVSNFWFYREDAYIAEASALKPLLHTWSLAVEEQYYILAPIALVIIRRFFNSWLMALLVLGFVASFALAQATSDSRTEFAFFLLPTRAWEVLAGAILAKLELDWRARGQTQSLLFSGVGSVRNEVLTALGLLMIVVPMALMSETMPHPSYLTLAPVLGTVLVILSAREGGLVRSLLANRAMVGVGLISYSLYLWHWPIFAYMRVLYETLSVQQKLACIAAAFVLAIGSYFLIERPFRGPRFGKRTFAISTVAVFAALMFVFSNFHATNGALYRLDKSAREQYRNANFTHWHTLSDAKNPGRSLQTDGKLERCYMRDPRTACRFGNEKWVTVGDSYAGSYNLALRALLKPRGDDIIDMSYSRCSFVSEIWFANTICVLVNRLRWEVIRSFEDNKVFIITMNDDYLPRGKVATADPKKDFDRRLKKGEAVSEEQVIASYHENIRTLLELGHRVVLITSMPKPGVSVPDLYFRQLIRRAPGSPLSEIDFIFNPNPDEYDRIAAIDRKLRMEPHPNLIQVFPGDIFCREEHERRCININRDGPIYASGGHPSVLGATIVLEQVLKEYDRRYGGE